MKAFINDFRKLSADIKDYIRPKPTATADEFIARFEAREERETKDQALRRLALDRLPCRLTDNDVRGFNDPAYVKSKLDKLKAHIDKLSEFEKEWQ